MDEVWTREKLKRKARRVVEKMRKRGRIHQIVMDGCVGHAGDGKYRLTKTVILTCAGVDEYDQRVWQSVGIAYLNPTPQEGLPQGDEWSDKLGVKIARAKSELSLGLQIMWNCLGDVFDFGRDADNRGFSLLEKMVREHMIRSAHSLPSDIRQWKRKS